MENRNIDNVNNPNHYKLDCGIESIKIIETVLGAQGFVAFCLGNILKYLIRAEKKNGKEDYKKAAKYLEWIIERDNKISFFTDIEDLEKEFYVTWSQIISEIAKDLSIKKAFQLDSVFRNIFNENYEIAFNVSFEDFDYNETGKDLEILKTMFYVLIIFGTLKKHKKMMLGVVLKSMITDVFKGFEDFRVMWLREIDDSVIRLEE